MSLDLGEMGPRVRQRAVLIDLCFCQVLDFMHRSSSQENKGIIPSVEDQNCDDMLGVNTKGGGELGVNSKPSGIAHCVALVRRSSSP